MNKTIRVTIYDRAQPLNEYGGQATRDVSVTLRDESITVEGHTLPIEYEYNTVYRLMKRSIRSSNVSYLYSNLLDNFWQSFNTSVCDHVMAHGKVTA